MSARRVALSNSLAIYFFFFSFVGCQSAGSPSGRAVESPESLSQSFGEALETRQSEELYQLMSRDAQAQLSLAELDALLRESPEEYQHLVQQLRSNASTVSAHASVYYGTEYSFSLPLEEGEFRVPAEGVIPGAATSIEGALSQLNFALRSARHELLAMVYTKDKRLEYERERLSMLKALEKRQGAIISRVGSTASVQLEAGHRVILKLEKGRWLVSEYY